MARKKPSSFTPRIVNRKARHDYHVLEKTTCGVVLTGSEVKSVRQGQVSLAEGFARIEPKRMELWLHNVDIAPYAQAGSESGHEPKRTRKLLARKREIARIHGLASTKGSTIIPLTLFFSRGYVKVEIGVCHGKRQYDKRQDIKKRETGREMRKAMTRKVIR